MHADTPAPYRRISSKPISLADGSEMLDRYLQNSLAHSHLHPDALITPTGTNFSALGSSGGVVMHNLRRVAAGLKGEHLEPEPTPEPEGKAGAQNDIAVEAVNGLQEEVAVEGAQDMEEFQREEGVVEVGEIGDRTNFVQEEVPGSGKSSKKDKEARKKAKKAKDKEFRAQKEKARAEKSA